MLTAKQLAWASQHDWFYGLTDVNEKRYLVVRWSILWPDGTFETRVATWIGSFSELKLWAGY